MILHLRLTIYCELFDRLTFSIEFYTIFFLQIFKISNWVNKQETNEMIPIAFDMEWPFTFQTGPGKTAVIQLCANIELCYVFHIANLKKLPSALVKLLTNDKVCLNGVNIKWYVHLLSF